MYGVRTLCEAKQPWTLFPQGGTAEVPFLRDLQYTKGELLSKDSEADPSLQPDVRAAWKEYLHRILPHAYTQIRNFMLASIAEGRNFEDEEDSFKRGEAVRCDLTKTDLEHILAFHLPGPSTSSAQGGTNTAQESGATQRVWKSANLAVQLANLSDTKRSGAVDKSRNITKLCRSQTASASTIPEPEVRETIADAQLVTVNWRDRYAIWHAEVSRPSFVEDDKDDHIFVPGDRGNPRRPHITSEALGFLPSVFESASCMRASS